MKLVVSILMSIFTLLLNTSFSPNNTLRVKLTDTDFLFKYLAVKYPNQNFNNFILIEANNQELTLIKDGKVFQKYKVSTAKKGLGNKANSECTPLGLHKIASKTGDGVPLGGIINGSGFTGKITDINYDSTLSQNDYLTSRAIRLEGLEENINKGGKLDTYARHIYIHGTPDEGLIGKAVSHGCIRMKNSDIITFYQLIEKNTLVVILKL